MGQSNSVPFHWPLSEPLQAILLPCAKSSSEESLACALRLAQSGTIWHLSDGALVARARNCLPTGRLCLSRAPVPQPRCTAVLATCQPIAGHSCRFHSTPPRLPSLLASPARHTRAPPGPVAPTVSFQELLQNNVQNLNI